MKRKVEPEETEEKKWETRVILERRSAILPHLQSNREDGITIRTQLVNALSDNHFMAVEVPRFIAARIAAMQQAGR